MQPAIQPLARRWNLTPYNLGNLLVSESIVIAQHDDLSLSAGELCKQFAHLATELVTLELLLRSGGWILAQIRLCAIL